MAGESGAGRGYMHFQQQHDHLPTELLHTTPGATTMHHSLLTSDSFSSSNQASHSLVDVSMQALESQPFHSQSTTGIPFAPPSTNLLDEPQEIMAKLSTGFVQGVLLPGAIYHRTPDSPFPQRRYAALFDQPIAAADCAADVFEAGTDSVYGHIVQVVQYSRIQVAYVVCAMDALWDTGNRFTEEARLATSWYNRERLGNFIPARETIEAGGAGIDSGVVESDSSLSQSTGDIGFIPAQPDFTCPNNSEPKHTSPTSLSSDRCSTALSPESVLPLLPNLEECKVAGQPGQRWPAQTRFMHYRLAGKAPETARYDANVLRKSSGVTGQLRSKTPDVDLMDGETPFHALLPDGKCPFRSCEYHGKGFARKHDLVRHIITHYDGRLYCGFCPDGLAKSFGRPFLRVEPLKRHLAAVHNAAKFRKTENTTEAYLKDRIKEYEPVNHGQCSICMGVFNTAAELYNHIEDCVVQMLLRRARVANDRQRAEVIQMSLAEEGTDWDDWAAGRFLNDPPSERRGGE